MDLINEIKNRIIHYIWERDIRQLKRTDAWLLGSLRIGYLTIRDTFFDSQLSLWAMSLVYTTLLSIVPLIAVSVSVLKGYGAQQQIEPVLMNFLTPLGDKGKEIYTTIITFVDNINTGLLGSLGLALLLYTVISLMQKIEHAFNFTWHVSEERSFARRFSDYLSVVMVGPILVFTAMGLTAQITKSTLYVTLSHYPLLEWLFVTISYVLPYFLIILAFTLVYIYIPNTKVRFRAALIGGVIAGLIWQTVGWLFSSFIANANYTAIYSAFAALFFFMIWIYISWTILLVGSSIAFYYQNPEFRLRSRRVLELSNRMKEKVAIVVMAQVAQAYYDRQHPPAMLELARGLNVASESLAPIINTLVKQNLLAKTDADPPAFLPGQAPESLSVTEIISTIRCADESEIMNYNRLPGNARVDGALASLNGAAEVALEGKTLKDLINLTDK